MTLKEATIFKRLIKEKLVVFGQCKVLSLGFDDCPCALCQLLRMDTREMKKKTNELIKKRQYRNGTQPCLE